MYLDYFELNAKPFQITTDPKFLWLGEKHKEALATLRYGIEDNRGFLLLTGEVGTGKTILINRLISLLNIDTVVATLSDPDLESMDFYNMLAHGLKMKRSFASKAAFLIHLRDFLYQSYEEHKQVLLVIDESQRLNHRLMEDIRVLSNIELRDRKLINIFFVGQQEFNNILMTPQNRALAQRITVRYHIEPLDQKETGEYIRHRLMVAGSKKQIFKPSAVNEVFRFSGGIPRLINIVCDHAMLTAYGKNLKLIDAGIINECAEELRIPVQRLDSGAGTLKEADNDFSEDENDWAAYGAGPPAAGSEQVPMDPPKARAAGDYRNPQSLLMWKVINIVSIVLIIGALAYGISRYAGAPEHRYKDSELTPQKYKSRLETEQKQLAEQLRENRSANGEPVPKDDEHQAFPEPPEIQSPGIAPQVPPQSDAIGPGNGPQGQQPEDQATPVAGPEAKNELAHATQPELKPLPLMAANVTIQFNINSNEIDNASYPVLERVAKYLVGHPDQIVNVKGYTDNSGTPGYNETVSRFRANAVKVYLIGKGVRPENIRILAMGDADPIASNDTAAGRKKNRRVEVEFLQDKTAGN